MSHRPSRSLRLSALAGLALLSSALPLAACGDDTAPPSDTTTLSLWPDDGLADRLSVARDSAEEAAASEARSRAALYRALGHAYDFALAAEQAEEDYAELLADAGLKAQARAPMTPVVKLVFGVHYDKSRLTEFAAALSWAKRERVSAGTLAPTPRGSKPIQS